MAKIGSSQPPPPSPLGGRRIGAAVAGEAAAPPQAVPPAQPVVGTLAQRLEAATLAGPLAALPPAYDDGGNGRDWEAILGDDVFAQLYLAATLHEQVSDEQVMANQAVLTAFWNQKRNRFLTGDRDVDELYRPGTVAGAEGRLAAAAAALATAAGRAACFAQLEGRRREGAGRQLDGFMRPLLQLPVLNHRAFEQALASGTAAGFAPAEAETHLLRSLRAAGYGPVRTLNQSPNLLLAEWTPGGMPLTNRPSTKVMGQDVYTLAEAGQVLCAAYTSGPEREKAARNLDSVDYLENIAKDLRENDVQLDLREVFADRKLTAEQRRLRALYTLGPGLPFDLGGVVPAFASPADLLARTAQSAKDFGVAEAAFTAGLLPIWLRAAAPAEVRAALPAQHTALDFRRFLHQAAPGFPLWVGSEKLANPAALAAYIRRDENTWKMVYGSLQAGNLAPWLTAQNQQIVLQRYEVLVPVVLGAGLDESTENGRQLVVQALLQALEPNAPGPTLEADLPEINFIGLSGETPAARTLTLTNTAGGAVRVLLAINPPLDGVTLVENELFFGQRAPGQRLAVKLIGNPTRMPRDGQHISKLEIRSVYDTTKAVPVRASAVFPHKEFWQFVLGAGLALAAVLGGARLLLEQLLGSAAYARLLAGGSFIAWAGAPEAAGGRGGVFALVFVGLMGALYFFFRILRRLATSKSSAAAPANRATA